MIALFRKELASFFNTLTGYVFLIIITLISGLTIWLLPGVNNILDGGYATLAPLFKNAPWIMAMMVPALTMKTIAEEKKLGTIDLLYAKPLSEFQIIIAKYLASLILVIIALIPTLIYFISVYFLGNPVGNIDIGATWGSYIGLIFLGAAFCSIGIYVSSLTNNLIIAFISGIFLCGIVYSLPQYVAVLLPSGAIGSFVTDLSASSHFQSLSRGVIDTRNIVYFLSIVSLFISLTVLQLRSRLW